MKPICINKQLLKQACLTKWKKEINIFPKPNDNIKNPSWESVLKAITFLKSGSNKAQTLANNIVKSPTENIKTIIIKEDKTILYFINKNKPAVTSVLLWTKALTGVGADIALGSHLLKGNWALLVKLVSTRIKNRAETINIEEKIKQPLKNKEDINQNKQ